MTQKHDLIDAIDLLCEARNLADAAEMAVEAIADAGQRNAYQTDQAVLHYFWRLDQQLPQRIARNRSEHERRLQVHKSGRVAYTTRFGSLGCAAFKI